MREMLGAMTHFQVSHGAIHSFGECTQPAAQFAAQHNIALLDGAELAEQARQHLSDDQLNRWLLDDTHYCPKCEAPMLRRTSQYGPFWGCSRFPRCRMKVNEPRGALTHDSQPAS